LKQNLKAHRGGENIHNCTKLSGWGKKEKREENSGYFEAKENTQKLAGENACDEA